MKKILSGMFYNLFRGFEIWLLLILVVICGVFDDINNLRDYDVIAVGVFGETRDYSDEDRTLIISPDNIDQFRYKGSGISAFDVYRYHIEPLPKDVYDKLGYDMYYIPHDEANAVFDRIKNLYIFPAILMAIFIPVFFGRLFRQGTIKNLLTCGYSKVMIYLASLIMSVVLDLALFLIRLLGFVLVCACLQWQPPVYLPVLIPSAVVSLLLLITISSFSLAALFISSKRTAAFVVGFIMAFSATTSVSELASTFLWNYEVVRTSAAENEDYMDFVKEQKQYLLEERFNFGNFSSDFYYGDKLIISLYAESSLPAPLRYVILALIYSDPALIQGADFMFEPYLMARDGLLYVSMGVNTIWIILSSGLGIAIFRKREIHC